MSFLGAETVILIVSGSWVPWQNPSLEKLGVEGTSTRMAISLMREEISSKQAGQSDVIWKPLARSLILAMVIGGISYEHAWSGGPKFAPYMFGILLAASCVQLVMDIVRWKRGYADG